MKAMLSIWSPPSDSVRCRNMSRRIDELTLADEVIEVEWVWLWPRGSFGAPNEVVPPSPIAEIIGSALRSKHPARCLHSRFACAPGLVSQRPHLLLEKFGLHLDRVLHVFGLDQLVAEIESRSDITLHEFAELLGLVADRQWRGGQPFLQKLHSPY